MSVIPQTIQLLEEKVRGSPLAVDVGKEILAITTKAKATKAEIKKWDYIKLKSCTAKKTIIKMKRKLWVRIFANHLSGKVLISKIHKELIELNSKKKKKQ